MSDTLMLGQVHVREAQPVRQAPRNARPQTAAAIATPRLLAGALVVVAALAAYLFTLAPDMYSLDSPELAAAANQLGIAHAPGYPLYTLVGWLFSHAFPIGTVAFRMNLLSALFGVAACAAVYALSLHLTPRPFVAAAGALTLGFSYYFWLDSLMAEVYTLDALLVAGLLLAAYGWRAQPSLMRAASVGLILGLACANRTTSFLYLPALVAFAWLSGERAARSYAAAGLGLAGGLLFYLYLPLRSAAGVDVGPGTYALDGTLRVTDLASFSGFWDHVSAAAFRREAFAYGPLDALVEAGRFAGWLAGSFLGVGVALGIAGIVRQWQNDRALLVLTAGVALPAALFFVNYGAIDKKFMFLPAYVAWALWVVVGLDWLLAYVELPAGSLWAAGALALPLVALLINGPLVTLRGEHAVRDEAEQFLAQVAPDAVVYGRFTDVAPLQYLQQVEGQRPDVRLVNGWTADPAFLVELAAANVGVRPLYITQTDAAVCARYACVPAPAGNGYEVRPPGG
ncbi:MAG: DUF2723 domain-containing protein [Chloroflexi bacterium]|nr:DUF2723 domain-containing protein [Chloroflexota bacterium]